MTTTGPMGNRSIRGIRIRGIRRPALLLAVILLAAACGSGGGGEGDAGPPSGGDEPAEAGGEGAGTELIQEWTWRPPGSESAGTPAVDADAVALTVSRHLLVVLDPATGRLRWEREHRSMREVAPLLTASAVVVPTQDGLMAADRADGGLRWEVDLGDRANTPVPAAGGRLVTTLWDGAVVAVHPESGEELWRVPLPGAVLGPAAADGSTVVVTWDSGRAAGVVALDAGTGSERWSADLPPDGVSAPAIHAGGGGGGTVVLVAGDVAAHAFALDSGAPRWRVETEGAGSPELPPLPLDGGQVLVPHRQGGLALLDLADGAVLWDASSPEAAVAGGVAGPSPLGSFALVLFDGSLLVANPDWEAELLEPPSLTSGVAMLPSGWLVVATGQGPEPEVSAISDW